MNIALLCMLTVAGDDLKLTADQDDPRQLVVSAALPDALRRAPTGRIPQATGEQHLVLSLVDSEDADAGPPILARYERVEDRLQLSPRFRLVADKLYRATLRLPSGKTLVRHYRIPPRTKNSAASVTSIYPSSDTLPANVLKFYIHFSQPMREGKQIFDQIQIVDAAGKPIPDPWRRSELWNADATRLTLWIHPGRIKRGVNLREDFGTVLRPEQTYRLVITREVLDAEGTPLAAEVEKPFRTIAEDHACPNPQSWKRTPPANTGDCLQVDFGEAMDRPLALRMLWVTTKAGQVAGEAELSEDERTWKFRPAERWQPGRYHLHVDRQLEDVAGNTPVRPFQVDLNAPALKPPALRLPFDIQADR